MALYIGEYGDRQLNINLSCYLEIYSETRGHYYRHVVATSSFVRVLSTEQYSIGRMAIKVEHEMNIAQ